MLQLASMLPPPCLRLCTVVAVILLCCEATTPRHKCSVQDTKGVMRSGDPTCSFTYYPSKDCDFMATDRHLHYKNASQDLENLIVLDVKGDFLSLGRCHPLNRANALLDLRFTLRHSRRVMLVVSGVTSRVEKRCVTVEYQEQPGWEMSTLTIQTLPLPHGAYTATLLIFGREHQVTSHVDVMVIGHQSFYVHHTVCYRWNKVQRRSKHVRDTSFLLPVGSFVRETRGTDYPCKNCYIYNYTYLKDIDSLQFFYQLNATKEDSCFNNCSNVSIWLYKHSDIHIKTDCTPDMYFSLMNMTVPRQPIDTSEGLGEYRNLESGCYVIQLKSKIDKFPHYTYSFWVEPSNYVNMDNWNTTFSLDPNHMNRSLSVHWMPNLKYNFSEYMLQLWHKNSDFICRGDDYTPGHIDFIPSNGPQSVSGTSYKFHGLKPGWYCARLQPKDDRCPSRGCPALNSRAKMLKDIQVVEGPTPLNIIPIVIGMAVLALLAGIVLACCVLRHYPTCGGYRPTFENVSSIQGLELKDTPVILLVWTPYGPHGADFVPIIKAFKDVLHSYCHCNVYDYMDLPSLPAEQRHHLLNSPIAWLNNLLTKSNIKIIIVANEGAKLRQEEGLSPVISQNYTNTPQAISPHDSMLFPYLLRSLQDRFQLAVDYSRVFHVRFSDVSDSSAELENIVPWTRFRLPEHLKSLTLSIHGIPESCNIDEPSKEMLRKLSDAIVAHPLYSQFEHAKLQPSMKQHPRIQ